MSIDFGLESWPDKNGVRARPKWLPRITNLSACYPIQACLLHTKNTSWTHVNTRGSKKTRADTLKHARAWAPRVHFMTLEWIHTVNKQGGQGGEGAHSSTDDCVNTLNTHMHPRSHTHTHTRTLPRSLSATSQSHSVTQCWYSVWSWQLSFNWPGWCSTGRCHAAGSLRGCGTGPTVGAVKRPTVSTGTLAVGVPPHLGVHRQSAN